MLNTYKSEDASVGTWLAPLEIERYYKDSSLLSTPYFLSRHHDIRFDTQWVSRGCLNDYLVTHKQSARDMIQKQQRLDGNMTLCQEEKVLIRPWIYDWSKKPEECCKQLVGPEPEVEQGPEIDAEEVV